MFEVAQNRALSLQRPYPFVALGDDSNVEMIAATVQILRLHGRIGDYLQDLPNHPLFRDHHEGVGWV